MSHHLLCNPFNPLLKCNLKNITNFEKIQYAKVLLVKYVFQLLGSHKNLFQVKFTMTVEQGDANVFGTMHGGLGASLVDLCSSVAILSK